MPFAVHEGGFALSSLHHETTFLIGSDCAFIVGKHPNSYAMEFELCEGMLQKQTDCLAPKSFSKECWVINGNRH